MASGKNATPLSVLSRSTVNRNVKREDVDSLPLPRSVRDECFANVASDRSDESYRRKSLKPCECCEFPKNVSDYSFRIPRWSEKAKSKCGAHLAYFAELPGLPKHAEWLELPDREHLISLIRRSVTSKEDRERLRACLNTLRFDPTTGLGRVHEWIHRYLFYQDQHGWYHVSVNAGCMKSFLEAMSTVDVVALPYGCVTDCASYITERLCLKRNWRQVILAVKNDDDSFKRAFETIKFGTDRAFETFDDFGRKICNARQFIETIAFVSRQEFRDGWFMSTRNYIVFEPMIRHAFWWMLLLIPQSFDVENEPQSSDVKFENCVVLLDPFYQCIGDPVETCGDDDSDGSPFVYRFDGKILNVKEITEVDHRDKQSFINWCVSREMNTLLNLNGNGFYPPTEYYECNNMDLSFSSSDEWSMSEYESEDSSPEMIDYDIDILDNINYNVNIWGTEQE